jgi:O-antigen/teichoic acid export membrane protein
MKTRSIKFNFAMNMIRTLMIIIFPLITFPYASRILLSEGIGKANFVASIVSYFQLLAALGIATYAITEGAKIRDNKKKLSHFATEILSINIISTVISYLIFIAIIQLPVFENYRTLLLIGCLSIIFSTIGMEWIYNIVEDYKYITIRSIGFQFISLILLFVLVRESSDVPQYIALIVIASAGSGILNFIHAKKYITLFSDPIKTYDIKKHIKPILIIFSMSIASTIYVSADITMLGIMKDNETVGIYTSAIKINQIICLLISSLSAVLLPRLSYYIALGDKVKFNDLVKKTIHFMLILIVPCMVGMYLLSEELILIMSGKDFIEAVPIMRIMTLNLFLSPVNGFLAYQIFMPYGKAKVSFYATLAGATGNMILNFLLIPKYSHEGAAFSTIIAEGIVLFVCVFYAKTIINIRGILNDSWQYVIATLPIIFVYYIVEWCDVTNLFAKSLLITIFGILVYGIALLIMKNQFLIDLLEEVKNKMELKNPNS